MAELSTVARPYAEALFAVAQSDGNLDTVHIELDALAAVAVHNEIQMWVKTPNVTQVQVLDMLLATLNTTQNGLPLSATTVNFLTTVLQNKRIALLPEIAAQFAVLKNIANGASDVQITSAFELSPEQLADLTAGLQKKFGLHLKPTVIIDTNLIGGVRVKVGDQVLDTSVQAQLEHMRVALML
jgi:F-type H+-transporting ATPase subunit delta